MTNQVDMVNLVNAAAKENDRWLMVAMLVAILASAFFAVRWLAGALEKLEAKGAAERRELVDSYNAERKERFEAMKKLQEESTSVIRDNTEAYARNRDVLDRVLEKLNHS